MPIVCGTSKFNIKVSIVTVMTFAVYMIVFDNLLADSERITIFMNSGKCFGTVSIFKSQRCSKSNIISTI